MLQAEKLKVKAEGEFHSLSRIAEKEVRGRILVLSLLMIVNRLKCSLVNTVVI